MNLCFNSNHPSLTNTAGAKTTIKANATADLFPQRMAAKANRKATTVADLVIQVSASGMPYSILAAFTQLATKYKCFIQLFVHGTAQHALNTPALAAQKRKIQSLRELFGKLNLTLDGSRSSYDYSVTLIWRKSKSQK